MQYLSSAEVHQPAFDALRGSEQLAEPAIKKAVTSHFAEFVGTVVYAPIIMPTSMHKRYKERTELRKSKSMLIIAPQLDFELFVRGVLQECFREYVNGIVKSASLLRGLDVEETSIRGFVDELRALRIPSS